MIFADINLARRLEYNASQTGASNILTIARLNLRPMALVLDLGKEKATFGSKDLFFLNSAVGLGLESPVNLEIQDEKLNRVEEFYRVRQFQPRLTICSLTDATFTGWLGRRGYRLTTYFHQLFLPLEKQFNKPSLPEEVEIVRVGPDEAKTWMATVVEGFEGKEDPFDPKGVNFALNTALLNRPEVTCYLARLKGIPAGAGALCIQDGIATLFSTSVKPAFRRQGVQAALIQARLAQASKEGCEFAAVMTIPGNNSQRNLQRQGFQLAYSRLVLELPG